MSQTRCFLGIALKEGANLQLLKPRIQKVLVLSLLLDAAASSVAVFGVVAALLVVWALMQRNSLAVQCEYQQKEL